MIVLGKDFLAEHEVVFNVEKKQIGIIASSTKKFFF